MIHRRRISALIGFLFVVSGFAAKTFYRDYIYSNHIDDLGIADTSPGFFYVIGFSQMLLIATSGYPKSTIFIVTMASVLFEFKQYFSTSILDYKDILASIAGGTVSFIIWSFIRKGSRNTRQ